MLNLWVVYLFLLLIFAAIGYLRGWQREIIAMAGLVGSIALLTLFGRYIVGFISPIPPEGTLPQDDPQPFRQMFWIQAGIHMVIAFFSYQTFPRLADFATRGRFGERLRSGIEAKITGTIFGVINGYLFIGALWGFLEYALISTQAGYYRLTNNALYAFDPDVITRPVVDSFAWVVAGFLPQHFSDTAWLIVLFVVFFVLIIALI